MTFTCSLSWILEWRKEGKMNKKRNQLGMERERDISDREKDRECMAGERERKEK